MHEGLFFIEKLIALAINHTGIVFIYALWVIMTSMKNKKGKKSWLHVYAWLIHSTFEFSFLKMKNVFYHCNITKSYYYSCCEKIIFILYFFIFISNLPWHKQNAISKSQKEKFHYIVYLNVTIYYSNCVPIPFKFRHLFLISRIICVA